MKKQVNLTQSDLYNVIKESVKNVILEFGTDPGKKGDENRTKMAKAAKRAVKRGDSSVYKNAYDSIIKGGGNKEALKDFQKKYEDEVEESRNLKEYTEFDKMKMYGQDVDYDEDFENLEDSENLEEYNDIDLQSIYGRPSYDEDFEDVGFNQQPSNVVTGEGRKPVKVTESQLKDIIRESVMRILQEEYTGDEPFVPNKYPGEMPNFHSKEEYRNWRSKEAPSDFFDWKDDRKFQRTGIQPGQSGLAPQAMRDRRDGKMSWNSDKNYNKFQMLKQKNSMQ